MLLSNMERNSTPGGLGAPSSKSNRGPCFRIPTNIHGESSKTSQGGQFILVWKWTISYHLHRLCEQFQLANTKMGRFEPDSRGRDATGESTQLKIRGEFFLFRKHRYFLSCFVPGSYVLVKLCWYKHIGRY